MFVPLCKVKEYEYTHIVVAAPLDDCRAVWEVSEPFMNGSLLHRQKKFCNYISESAVGMAQGVSF